MEVAIRDQCLYQAGYATAAAGLRELEVELVEVAMDVDGAVRGPASGERLEAAGEVGLRALREELRESGARVCAFLCSQDFHRASAPERVEQVGWVVRAVRAAEALGAPAVRVDSAMTGQAELPLEERIRIFAQGVREVLEATPESGVALGIENHGRQGNDPEWMRGVLALVGSPRLGLTLDVGNWYWYGHPLSRVYEIYREFGPLVKATHVKNIRYPEELRETQRPVGHEYAQRCCPLDEGDLDMRRLAGILRECGYEGPLTIENEALGRYAPEERPGILRRDADHLRAALAGP